jgi:protein-tyrosine phosphatase
MDHRQHRPIPESYWVEEDIFLAGEYPGHYDVGQARKRIDSLLEAGFNTFIDLTKPNELTPYLALLREQSQAYDVDIQYHRFGIGDFGLPTPELMKSILDQIDASLEAGRKVYLHCWGGIGRTGTTIGCYLVRRGYSGEEALRQLAAWWREVPKSRIHPQSPETYEQAAFIRNWARQATSPKGLLGDSFENH